MITEVIKVHDSNTRSLMATTSLLNVIIQGDDLQREQHPEAPFVVQTTVDCLVGDVVGLGVGVRGRYVGDDVGGIQAVRVGRSPLIVSIYRVIEGFQVIH